MLARRSVTSIVLALMPADARSPETATGARRRIGIGDCLVSERAKALVREVLDSNRLSAGPMMDRFEQGVASLHGCAFGLMSNSGTSALHIALAALKERDGWNDGDEVLVPALTFIATSNVVLYNGLTPVFVDVEPTHYCVDPAQIEARVTERTRAIVPVHVGGLPCDMDPILEIADRHGLRIVEDSCEALGVRYRGRPVGSFGDVGCFSTYVAHVITTGVGGVCTTNDAELHELMKSFINHGRDTVYTRIDDDADLERAHALDIPARRFSFVRLGHSFRATEMEAALGVAQLDELPARHARRMAIVARLTDGLRDLEDVLQLPGLREGSEHGFMFYPLVVRDPAVSRDALVDHLESLGIETRHLLPLVTQPVYERLFGDLAARYPVAAALDETAFYIGCQPELSDDDVDYVVSGFHGYFGRA
jgi:dTDP-4-amino-4,6-dideoxygalactose transaminase